MKEDEQQQKKNSTDKADNRSNFKNLTAKQRVGDAANRWLEKNRSLVLRQTPFWAQGLAGILIGVGGTAILVGVFFRIDEVVTLQGQLKSIGGTIAVKTPAGGKVAEIFFKDGQVVEKGQKLLRFDTRQATEEKAMLLRLIASDKKRLEAERKTILSNKEMLRSRQNVLSRRIETKSKIIKEMQVLVDQGGFQKLQFLEQKDQLFQLQNQLNENLESQSQLDLESKKLKLEIDKSIDQMTTSLKKAELQLQYQNVMAPISGVVFDPQASLDGVMSPGERILSVVPQQGLYAEAYVPNQDIGFIKLGQSAKIRIDAFPFTRYGELDGKVSQISADALEPDATQNFYRFPIKLSLENAFLTSNSVKIPLKPGMSITTNLKLRDKRVISLLSDLLVDQTDSIRSIRQQ